MRRWLGVGAGLLVLLAGAWFLLFSALSEPAAPGPGASRDEASLRERPPLNALLTAPVAPARGSLFIRGTVVGPSGPVAGAVVVATAPVPEALLSEVPCDCGPGCERKLLDIACGARTSQLVELASQRYGEAPPQARTTTDVEGRFSLEGLEAGAYAVWAEGPLGTGLVEDVAAGHEGVWVRLGGGLTLTGMVRNEEGAPLAGTRVTSLYLSHSRSFEVLTGEDGRFRVGPLPPGSHLLVFSRPDLLPDSQYAGEDVERELEVTLYRPRRLGGRVVRGAEPVPGAKVRAEGERRELDTVTDAEGHFAFDALSPGRYSLTASHEGQDAVAQARLEPRMEPPVLELSLGSGVRVRGTVRDERGRPIAGAEVVVQLGSSPYTADWKRVKTGADGAYMLGPLASGRHRLHVYAERFVATGPQERDVDGATPVDFVLKDAAVVEGRVVDAEGRPVGKARLLLKQQDDGEDFPNDYEPEDEYSPRMLGSSKEDGTFVLNAPSAGSWFLRGFHDDLVTVGLRVSAPQTGVVLVLGVGTEVAGEVVDEQGAPVRDAEVSLALRNRENRPSLDKAATTDARGRFILRGVSEGAYYAIASRMTATQHRRTVQVFDVRGLAPVHLRLQLPEGKRVAGQVVDTEGQPLAGVAVQVGRDFDLWRREAGASAFEEDVIERFAHAPSRVRTDEDGHFTVPHLEPGTWSVSASLPGYQFDAKASPSGEPSEGGRSLEVQAGATDVRLVMRRAMAIRGRVAREDGSPIMRFELDGDSITDTEGDFLRPVHRAGEVTLVFTAHGLAGSSRTVRVEKDQQVDLGTVVLKKGRVVRGRVTDAATGAPVAEALVDVGDVPSDAEGWRRRARLSERTGAVKTGSDGRFTLPAVEERPHALVVVHPDFLQKRIPLDARQDEVAVALDTGATVQGTVRGGGKGQQSVSLVSHDTSQYLSTEVVDARFEHSRVLPGTYVVRVHEARAGDDAPVYLPQRIQVPASGIVTVDFEPQTAGATVRLTLAEAPETGVAVLIPGQVALPDSPEAFLEAIGLHYRPHPSGPGTWTFRRVPAGPHTAFVISPRETSLAMLREELTVPAEGELARELAPRWHVMEAPASAEDSP